MMEGALLRAVGGSGVKRRRQRFGRADKTRGGTKIMLQSGDSGAARTGDLHYASWEGARLLKRVC